MDNPQEPTGSPPDEAYGRVTNPERYQVVVDAARALVDELVAEFDVHVSVELEADANVFELVHVSPTSGAALTFGFSSFPGVVLRIDPNYELWLPACGCDACDESPEDLIEMLRLRVRAVAAGDYEVTVTRREVSWRSSRFGPWGSRPLARQERRDLAGTGTTTPDPWPPRRATGPG